MSLFFYRRPSYIDDAPGPITHTSCHSYANKAKCNKQLIPESLAFDQIIHGQTLPPASLNDFMDYLLHVSRSAENLQFLLWLKDYTKRFNALSTSESELSPESTASRRQTQELRNFSLPRKALIEHKSISTITEKQSFETDRIVSEDQVQAQPFRAEINLVIQHYLISGAPRELNLCYRVRGEVLERLKSTTHPSAFKSCRDLVEQTLRHQSHPNFIRWAMANGRRPRTIILRHMCALTLLTYIGSEILLILCGKSRWLRIAMSPILLTALMQFQCVLHNLCLMLFITGEREMRPWEMFASDEEIQSANQLISPYGVPILPSKSFLETPPLPLSPSLQRHDSDKSSISSTSTSSTPRFISKLNPFGSRNSFELESWTRKWNEMPWFRKWTLTFSCHKIAQKDPAVKQFQARILWQSFFIGLLVTVLVTAALVCIPEIDLF